jgi:putative ABC transport system permease protein
LRLAIQNLGQRKARTSLLVLAVAISCGAVFLGAVLMLGIRQSMEVGFTRLGADLLVVPQGTLTNITAALLTAEPTDQTLDRSIIDELAKVKGVQRVAPQFIVRTHVPEIGGHHGVTDLMAFDPERDISVTPWLAEKIERPFRKGDVIVGGRREERIGDRLLLFGRSFTVYGRLERTGVGPHENGIFMSFETFDSLRDIIRGGSEASAALDRDKISGALIELAPGASAKQARFAMLAKFPGLKVVVGESMLTSIRQGLEALLNGVITLLLIMFISSALMIGLLFSAIIGERKREIGLLMAVGFRSGNLIALLLAEAAIATATGGVLGCVLGAMLMRVYEHSLFYHLKTLGVPFIWPGAPEIAAIALVCLGLTTSVGIIGALAPALYVSRREPYELIRAEG